MRPILLYIGSIPVRSFGIMVLIGFLLALWYAMSAARRRMVEEEKRRGGEGETEHRTPEHRNPITPDHIFDFSLMALFVCIAGARTLYVLMDLNEFRGRWSDVFKVWTGGISIHGAIISGALFLWWYCRKHKLNFLAMADICAPAFALGYAIGRVGCFLNGCCYGHACALPWGVRFTDETSGGLTPPSHPTQLYATLM